MSLRIKQKKTIKPNNIIYYKPIYNMYRALIAFCSGLYIGSYYNCKPVIEHFIEKIKEHFPEKK